MSDIDDLIDDFFAAEEEFGDVLITNKKIWEASEPAMDTSLVLGSGFHTSVSAVENRAVFNALNETYN